VAARQTLTGAPVSVDDVFDVVYWLNVDRRARQEQIGSTREPHGITRVQCDRLGSCPHPCVEGVLVADLLGRDGPYDPDA